MTLRNDCELIVQISPILFIFLVFIITLKKSLNRHKNTGQVYHKFNKYEFN